LPCHTARKGENSMRSCEERAAKQYLLDSARMFKKDGMSLEEFLALANEMFTNGTAVAIEQMKALYGRA
jgi:hypothetical protein